MDGPEKAAIYLEVACAVIASADRQRLGQGDVAADAHEARRVRAAARAMYAEIAEEMELLEEE